MSEIRQDIVTGKHVIIAVERGKRPHDFSRKEEVKKREFCPFCEGNEKETPPEVAALRDKSHLKADTPGWRIRVVPNKFAAVNPEEKLKLLQTGIYTYLTGKGAAEVVIESPDHHSTLGSHNLQHVEDLLQIIQDRFLNLSRDKEIRYVQIFKNYGSVAGASLEHPHWQIISTPLIPTVQIEELKGAAAYFNEHGRCVFCTMIAAEKESRTRLVAENDFFIAFCPYASRYPFETWILPKDHQSTFGSLTEGEITSLARILQGIIHQLEEGFNPPYNLIIHSAPVGDAQANHFHWHIEILPRLTITAGFELGTGIFINPIAPEIAAETLKL